jgi:hypothetical protein
MQIMEPLLDKLARQNQARVVLFSVVFAAFFEAFLCFLFHVFGELSIVGNSNELGELIYCMHIPGFMLLSFLHLPFATTGRTFFAVLMLFTTIQWFLLTWSFVAIYKRLK